jgi:alkanesulfonate monooxygenase SsuD/methylene tetrahydromethanopterin reductase-like flavin-dependent oxidoreductase (luciferase family)
VFSVVQDIDEAKAGYASLKNCLPEFDRKAEDVAVLPGVMPIVGRTDKEAFEKLNVLQSFVSGSNALAILSDRFGQDMSAYDLPILQERGLFRADYEGRHCAAIWVCGDRRMPYSTYEATFEEGVCVRADVVRHNYAFRALGSRSQLKYRKQPHAKKGTP